MLLLMLTAGLTLEPGGLLVGWGISVRATEQGEDVSDDVAYETELPEVVVEASWEEDDADYSDEENDGVDMFDDEDTSPEEDNGEDEIMDNEDPEYWNEEEPSCDGEQCEVCGGYKTSGQTFRSARADGDQCQKCVCQTSDPCRLVSRHAEQLLNQTCYKQMINLMHTDSGTIGKCGVLIEHASAHNKIPELQYEGRIYDDLNTFVIDHESYPYEEQVVVHGVVFRTDGRNVFTDRELVELLEMFANRVSFSGIYLLDGKRIYSLRIDNAMFYQDKVKELKKDLEGDNFKEDSRPGQNFEKAIKFNNSNHLLSKIAMYNEMDMGISYLEGSLEGDRYVFTKIDAQIETHPDGSQEIIENKCE